MALIHDGREMNNFNSKRKIPHTYKEAAKILKEVEVKKGLNNLLGNIDKSRKGRISAIVYNVLQNQRLLDHLIENTPLGQEVNLDFHILKVILQESLVRKKLTLEGNNRPERLILKYEKELDQCLSQYLKVNHVKDVEQLGTQKKILSKFPRFIRINTLKSTKETVLRNLRKGGFRKLELHTSDYDQFLKIVDSLEPDQFVCDLHFDELLIFHPTCSFESHSLLENGTLIRQDKASLLPATFLNPKTGSLVLDCCAAPGLKTSHIAALKNKQCSIIAMDRSAERMESMKSMLEWHDVTNVEFQLTDFTSIDPNSEPYKKVRYILLDPSCSGTGMVRSRLIAGYDSAKPSDDRLKKLASFQSALLRHALSFPKVRRITYSTCSIESMENEDVVLEAYHKFSHSFELVEHDETLPFTCSYENHSRYSVLSKRVLKTDPYKDLTNGFFVAVFQRIKKKKRHLPSE